MRFPGQRYDDATGLHYNCFRDYDPLTGRYVESDPIGLDGGVSTYGYVASGPLSHTDRLGLDKDPACVSTLVAVGALELRDVSEVQRMLERLISLVARGALERVLIA